VAGDETQARHDLERLAAGVLLPDLCDRVIAPALRQIGSAWADGKLSIAAEHRATAICERLIAARANQPPGRPRGTAVTATPPGERHALPGMMAAAWLREDHWQVHHLAADLPATDVIRLAADTAAGLIVLSSATASAVRLARQDPRNPRAAARRACPDRPSRRHARPVARARPAGHPCRWPRFLASADARVIDQKLGAETTEVTTSLVRGAPHGGWNGGERLK
jgi:hypothetical protein